MKSIFIISIQLFYWSFIFSQNMTLYLYAEDNVGNRDTVTFGFNEMSTIGIDTTFGENNIYNIPQDSLEMRFILRDSLTSGCLDLNFSENIDLKTDIRPFSGKDDGNLNFYSLGNIFELNVNAIEYPVTIRTDLSDIPHLMFLYSNVLKNNCDPFDEYQYLSDFEINDTLVVLVDSTFNTIIFNMQHEVGIENFIQPTWKIFPNPANQWIVLTDSKPFNGLIEILDINGKAVFRHPISNKNEITTDINDFAAGIYFVKYSNQDKSEISIRKLIKE